MIVGTTLSCSDEQATGSAGGLDTGKDAAVEQAGAPAAVGATGDPTMAKIPVATTDASEATTPPIRIVELKEIAQAVDQHRGRVVLLDVWATWCGPCIEQFPKLAEWRDRFGRDQLAIVSVNIDSDEDLAGKVVPFLRQQQTEGMDLLMYTGNHDELVNGIDPKWAGEVPALFLYDREGRLRKSLTGEHEPEAVEKAIQSLM